MSATGPDKAAGGAGARKARGALRGAALGLLGAAIVAGLAALVVWPLWYLATEHTGVYTLAASVAIVAGIAWSIASGLRGRRDAQARRPPRI